MEEPLIGLIVPPAAARVPPDALRLYGERARFAVEGLAIDEMTEADFDAARQRVTQAARALGERGVRSIALLGTSLSFYRGAAFNDALQAEMAQASGCPAVTATSAVVEALRNVNAVSLAVGAAYDSDMCARLKAYFEQAGFRVAGLAALSIRKVSEALAQPDEAIVSLAQSAMDRTAGADALFLSCGAFATGHLLEPLERRFGVPVVSTTPAALAAAFRAVGPA